MPKCYGVIGKGSIAQRHISNLRKIQNDAYIYTVSSSGKNHNLLKFANESVDFSMLLKKKLEFVVVASPSTSHAEHAIELLNHGFKVLVEKPITATIADCERIRDAMSRTSNQNLRVAYCLRFLKSADVVRKFLRDFGLGRLYSVFINVGQYLPSWRPNIPYQKTVSAQRALGGGVLLELSHEIDYARWLFGDLQIEHCILKNVKDLDIDVEGIADIVCSATDGLYVHLHLDFLQKKTRRTCEVIGDLGVLEWDLLDDSATVTIGDSAPEVLIANTSDPNQKYIEMLEAFEKEFSDNRLATLEDGLAAVRLVEKAREHHER
jgi:predicted dehydrogenase